MYGWLKRLIMVGVPLGIVIGVGVYLELIRVTTNGIEVLHEADLTTEQLIRRGDLYFGFFRYEDAMRVYCKALFDEKPAFKEPLKPFKPGEGEVDLEHIADDYELDVTAKRMPQIPQALFNLGVCYVKDGKAKEAMMVFSAFRQLFPGDPLAPAADRNMEDLRLNRL